MELNTAQQFLVIVLSATLAIFLVLAIVAIIFIIRVLSALRRVAERAEKVVQSAEAVGDMIKNVTGPASIMRFARTILETVSSHKQAKDKE